jgi:hypothetical protein
MMGAGRPPRSRNGAPSGAGNVAYWTPGNCGGTLPLSILCDVRTQASGQWPLIAKAAMTQ